MVSRGATSTPRRGSDDGQGRPSTANQGTADLNVLATAFSTVARALQAESDTGAMLDEVVAAAVRLIPGVQDASISVVVARTSITSQHPTSPLPEQVDAIQTEVGEGPCLDAAYEHRTVRVPDMRHEQRWPKFARRAHALGVGSMLSFQLFVVGDNLGALNLFSRETDAFDDESEQVGLLFASHAAIALADARKVDHFEFAVASRDLIGQAKGILMERYSIDEGRAFTVLTRVSQATHRKLRDIAQELAATGRLPEARLPARLSDHAG
ncbi:MAG TPA: GAF and ANTAR domain-containing protein [Friedmanniella sp.]